jgi:hypothetical protein
MSNKKNVTNAGEAISVLIQTAELAQSRGILSLEDAFLVKQSIDLLDAMAKATQRMNGPIPPGQPVPETAIPPFDENQVLNESAETNK